MGVEGGTLILFQGLPCSRVVFRRSRGYASDHSFVDIHASTLVRLGTPAGDELARGKPELEKPKLDGLRGALARPLELAKNLDAEGTLFLAEAVGTRVWTVTIPRLFVARVSTVRRSDVGAVQKIRVHLVDERYFWTRGILKLWSFNRLSGGAFALDSVEQSGRARSLTEVVRSWILPSFFRSPKLAHAPDDWDQVISSNMELEPFGLAMKSLARVLTENGLEDPSLLYDGSVALYEAGDGKVGYALEAGAPNTEDFPPELLLSKEGTGQGSVLELGYPEPYLLVLGGKTVANVAIDDWEPVLVVRGKAVSLTEDTVRTLTRGTRGLAWLRRWILEPPAHQGEPDLPEAVTQILREQAFRLWRLPGVVTEGGKPGPNVHLLPLRPRIEVEAGAAFRPVTVETYRFTARHVAYFSSPAQTGYETALLELAQLKDAIEAAARAAAKASPWIETTVEVAGHVVKGVAENAAASRRLQSAIGAAFGAGEIERLTYGEIGRALATVQLVERIKAVDPGLASAYVSALKEKWKIEDAQTARAFADLYQAVERLWDVAQGEVPDAALKARVLEELKAANRAYARAARGTRGKHDRPTSVVTHWNLARSEDPHASIYDAKQGVVRASELAGHLSKEDVPRAADGGPLVLCPVRVIFGTLVRPRLDRPQRVGAVVTGIARREPDVSHQLAVLGDAKSDVEGVAHASGPCKGGDTIVPASALSDEESYFRQAYKRTGRGEARRIEVTELRFDQALRVERPDLVELVALDGTSNRAILLLEADRLARAHFRRADLLRTTEHVVARPWLVQTDGVVDSIEIRSRTKEGGPCGFETVVRTGASALRALTGTRTRERRPRVDSSDDAAAREGVKVTP